MLCVAGGAAQGVDPLPSHCSFRALGGKKGASAGTPEEAAQLVGRAANCGLALPGLPALREALSKHAAWEGSVQRALSREGPSIRFTAA